MKSGKAYLVISKATAQQTVQSVLQNLLPDVTFNVTTKFIPEEAVKADVVFTDETVAKENCRKITLLKSQNKFLPFILVSTAIENPETKLPGCVDDILSYPAVSPVWEKRLQAYLRLRQSEKAFLKKENEYQSLFRDNLSVMMLIDPHTGQIVDANRTACRFYGYPYEILTRMKIQDINRMSETEVKREMEKVRAGKKNFFEYKHRLANGSIKNVEVYNSKVVFEGKTRLFSIVHDVTEKKDIEQRLIESEENYRKIIEEAPDVILLIDKKGIIKYINRRISDYGDLKKEDFIGQPVTRFVPDEDKQEVQVAVARIFDESLDTTSFFSTNILLKSGESVPVLTRGILLHFGHEPLNMTIIRDIRPLKTIQEKLKRTNETLQNIFDNSSVAIYVQNQHGEILDINKAALQQYGFSDKKELIGKTQDFVAAEGKNDLQAIKKRIQQAFEGKPQRFEFWAKRSDGSVFPKLVIVEKGMYFGQPAVFNFSLDITERKKMEEALRESEERYYSLFHYMSSCVAVYEVTEQGDILFKDFNRTAEKLEKVKKEDIIGKKLQDVFPGAVNFGLTDAIKKVFQTGKPMKLPIKFCKGNRVSGWRENYIYKLPSGEVVALYDDVTKRKQAEEKLKESEENYRLLFEKSPFGIFTIAPDGRILDANPALLQIIGSPSAEETKKINILHFPLLQKTGYVSYFKQCLATGNLVRFRTEYTSKWEKSFVAESTFVPLKDEKGNVVKIYTIIRDITEQDKAQKLLEESQKKYHSIFQHSSDVITITEFPSGKYVEANDRLEQLMGFSREEIIGKTSVELGFWVNPEDRQHFIERLQKDASVQDMEAPFRRKDGTILYGLVSAQLIPISKKLSILSEVRDITRIKNVEKALRESRQLFETLASISPTGIFRTDARGNTTYVNPKWSEITGLTFEVARKRGWIRVLHPDEKEQLLSRWQNAIATQAPSKEKYRVVRPDGTIRWVLGHAVPEITDGKLYGYVGTITDITDLVKTEQALRESENKYRALAETSSDLILTFDLNGSLTYLSPAVKKITGYKPEEILGRKFWEFVAAEHVDSTIEKFKRGIKGEDIPLYEIDLIHKNRKRVPIELSVSSLLDFEGKPVGRVVVARDITDRRLAEKALKESEARLRRFAQITTEGIVIHKNPIIVDANQSFLKMTGYTLDELVGQDVVKKLAHPKSYAIIYENIHKKYAKPYEVELIKKDGSLLPVEISAIDYTDPDGETSRAVVFHDITLRLKMEKNLRESENKYRSLAEGSIDLIVTYDLNGVITYVNPVAESIFGYKPEEVIGTKFTDYIPPPFKDLAFQAFNKGKQGEKVQLYELELIRKDGSRIPIEVNPGSLYDADGNITGRLSVVRDISVRKEAEKELLLRDKALNTAANAIIITSAGGTIEWVNEAFTKLTGYSKKEAIGKYTKELLESNRQDKAFFDNLHKIVLSGQVWKGEIVDKRKDGTLYTVEEIITPVTNENGKVEHLIGIMTDITERKKAERELLAAKEAAEEASRLKTAFLSNMNHEIRTPMNAIMGFSELMLETDSEEERENYAKIVNNSANQLLKLIDDVIYLSRLQSEKLPLKKIVFHPADVVAEIFEMFNLPDMKKNLDLRLSLPPNARDILIEADDFKIKQVLTNFMSNAIKYTSDGHVTLGLETEDTTLRFFVEDTGIGIPEEEQPHVFEAFYRGNEVMNSAIRGTGLGLNIAKELVQLMGGEIGVSSEHGKGSRFFFTLPYRQAKLRNTSKTPAPDISKKKDNLRILVAEDDDTNFLYMEVLLKNRTKKTDRARNGAEVLELLKNNRYDLILMDLKMPVLSGTEATREVKKMYPDLPVIATTAYATQDEREKALSAGCDAYLTKPISKTDLYALLNRYTSGRKH
jgi:PAS domain S-box-containing protein